MEKIIERYTMDRVFEVIEKHKGKFHELMDDTILRMKIADVVCDDSSDMNEMYMRELQDYASALASLELLERELRGEVEY